MEDKRRKRKRGYRRKSSSHLRGVEMDENWKRVRMEEKANLDIIRDQKSLLAQNRNIAKNQHEKFASLPYAVDEGTYHKEPDGLRPKWKRFIISIFPFLLHNQYPCHQSEQQFLFKNKTWRAATWCPSSK